MGKIIYDPKNNKTKMEDEQPKVNQAQKRDLGTQQDRYSSLIESIESVRPIGDTDCEYTIYLEDYAYTYIYQYASTDLSCEHSAAIIGEYYPENNEMIICGIMPIPKHKLAQAEEWINEEALETLYIEKEKYFPGAMILGWLHMQPGYGTMLTMKEVKVHRDLFNREGSILLLVDPINKIETFYMYEGDQLTEQSGYYIYYDKNASMQQYMLDRPFLSQEKEEVDDSVVTQFREIGRMRKKEYQQKKQANFTVVAASVALLAMTAVLLQVGGKNDEIAQLKNQLQQTSGQTTVVDPTVSVSDKKPSFVIEDTKAEDNAVAEVGSGTVTIIDNTATEKEDTTAVADETVVTPVEVVNEQSTEKPVIEDVEDAEVVVEAVAPKVEEDIVVAVEEEEEEDYILYVVQTGDNLRTISYDHYQTEGRAKDIIKLNDIQDGDIIYVGEELKLPAK